MMMIDDDDDEASVMIDDDDTKTVIERTKTYLFQKQSNFAISKKKQIYFKQHETQLGDFQIKNN